MKRTPDILIPMPKPLADDPIFGENMRMGFNLIANNKDDSRFSLIFSLLCHDGEFRSDRAYWMTREGLINMANYILEKTKV